MLHTEEDLDRERHRDSGRQDHIFILKDRMEEEEAAPEEAEDSSLHGESTYVLL